MALIDAGGGMSTTGSGKPIVWRMNRSPKNQARHTGPSSKSQKRDAPWAPAYWSLTPTSINAQGCQAISPATTVSKYRQKNAKVSQVPRKHLPSYR